MCALCEGTVSHGGACSETVCASLATRDVWEGERKNLRRRITALTAALQATVAQIKEHPGDCTATSVAFWERLIAHDRWWEDCK